MSGTGSRNPDAASPDAAHPPHHAFHHTHRAAASSLRVLSSDAAPVPLLYSLGPLAIVSILLSPLFLGAVLVAVTALGIYVFTRKPSERWLKPTWRRLYSRLGKDDVLAHDARAQMYEIIESEPGIHVSELVRRIDGGWGGLMHHLHVLEDKEFVTSREDGRYRRLFPVGQYDPDRMDKIATLKSDSTERCLNLVSRNPGINQSELASRMGMASPSVRYHLDKLREAGLVRKERDGRSVRYYARRAG